MHEEVVRRLARTDPFKGLKLHVKVVRGPVERRAQVVDGKAVWVHVQSKRIVFTGGKFGEHSIDASCSDEARILAHWEGYVEANGLKLVPGVGELVQFPSGSSPTGFRYGRVLKVGPRRAVISFRYYYGRRSTTTVKLSELLF